MEKFKILNRQSIENSINSDFNMYMQKEDFKKLVNRLKVSEKEIKKNLTKLNDTLEELSICSNCKGLYECHNKVEGYIYFPQVIDDKIRFVYTPCKKRKKFLEAKLSKETNLNVLENARMKDIDLTDKKRIKIIKWLKEFYDKFDVNSNTKGLFLHGSFGAGKTYLIACLFNELKHKKNIDSTICYLPELLRNLRDDFDLLERKVSYLKNVPLLLIDDIGAENVTAWGRDEILGSILQFRMNEGLSTFVTSNLNIEELERHLSISKSSEDIVKGRRIIERIKQLTEDMEILSENRRK